MTGHQHTNSAVAAAILEHVARHRLTVFEAVRRLPLTGMLPRKELKRQLQRLCREGQLGRASLYRHRTYYHLAAANDSDMATGPLAETAKVRSYAMLAFCCLGRAKRLKLSGEELEQHYPGLHEQGRPLNYYVTASGSQPSLGFLRVDCGGRGRWDRVLAKCRDDVERHRVNPHVRPLIEQGLFEITVITALPQKAERLARAMAGWSGTPTGCVRLCVLPELLNLIAPPPE